MSNLPVFSADLIKQLDRDYPERCPDPSDQVAEMWMKAGERRLVRNLLERLRQLEEDSNILEN